MYVNSIDTKHHLIMILVLPSCSRKDDTHMCVLGGGGGIIYSFSFLGTHSLVRIPSILSDGMACALF